LKKRRGIEGGAPRGEGSGAPLASNGLLGLDLEDDSLGRSPSSLVYERERGERYK
jgi:hypothetical protein